MPTETVSVVPMSPAGAVLLMLRDDRPDIPFPNTWATLGGFREPGETPAATAERELREEIGRGIDELTYVGSTEATRDEAGTPVRIHVFIGQLDVPAEQLTLGEGQRLRWVGVDELATLDVSPPSRIALAVALKAVGWLETNQAER